ncbi:hypothetical protein NDU88_002791 [Pleurodeles waltl]|uniref:Uncharacterized protein n=1 Tax=Pleurodeles waltl TaxID=8319 RepID=A0AAV7Q9W8_PLEWA|nr:hypothetical protein NDU88_002791 [Pleurodeles waltl]
MLPLTMQEAQIVKLPKQDKDLLDPGSYRPLCMLGVDVKILAKALATRLGGVVTLLVHRDQCCFMPGIETQVTLWKQSHVLHLVADGELEASLITLDSEKASSTIN